MCICFIHRCERCESKLVWLALLLVIQKSGAQIFVNVGGELSGCASRIICQDSTLSHISDLIAGYAPPGFFAATPVVPAYKIRERLFGIDLDKHAAEVAKAYAYASQTSNGIVKDGLSVSTMQASPWICHNQIIASGDICLNGYVLCSSMATLSTTPPMSSPSVCLAPPFTCTTFL